jgi:hypothetical protein
MTKEKLSRQAMLEASSRLAVQNELLSILLKLVDNDVQFPHSM